MTMPWKFKSRTEEIKYVLLIPFIYTELSGPQLKFSQALHTYIKLWSRSVGTKFVQLQYLELVHTLNGTNKQ